ncbi:MAG: twin arginine-targeting protein translocase TatB [Candidatus Muproteobacteria bacterium RBG_16_65_34]|uniref:Sec-independent protein translocase protein TatB n=1 Tax=Candidatus Muproteobacteria bacterium RBG_16_65_34 TaxID=1817760 RepID=A0A1F6TV72_9PROT|nr:MAG: twin arginine-targeting protein translocase TatB [Candidatus Muproteobacteria bacterium RBG_16_65_34]
MFDVGLSELLLIAVVALIVLGPKRLPEVARAAGRWLARIRRFVADVKQDFDREMHDEELKELRKLKDDLDDTRRLMQETSGKLIQEFTAIPEARATVANPQPSASPTPTPAPPAPEPPPSAVTAPRKRTRPPARVKREKKPASGKSHGRTRSRKRR